MNQMGGRAAILVLGLGALIGLFWGGGLFKELQINRAMLAAQHDIMQSPSPDACPALRLTNSVEPASLSALQASAIPRLQELEGLYMLAQHDAAGAVSVFAITPQRTRIDAFWLGCAEYLAGNIPQAVSAWRDADASDYFARRAELARAAHNLDLAMRQDKIALDITPESPAAWTEMAKIQFDNVGAGRVTWAEALVASEHALALSPQDPFTHYMVGYQLWQEHGDWGRAEQELRWSLAARNDGLTAYALGALLVDENKPAEAVAVLEDAKQESDTQWVRFYLVRAYAGSGQCAASQRERQSGLQKYPALGPVFQGWCQTNPSCACQ